MTLVSIDEYWQTILNDLTQFGKIETEDLDFNKRSDELWKVLENTLIKIDTEIVVEQWEKNLSLTVPSNSTLSDRKCTILNTLAKREYVPLSIIKRGLEIICGKGNCTFELDKENNKAIVVMSVNSSKKQILDVEFILERFLPHDITTEMEWSDGLPMTYTRLNYLESGGDPTEQYIITDVCLGDESEVVFSAPYYNDTNRILGAGITGETYSYLVGIAYTGRTFVRLRNYEQSFVYETEAGHDAKHVVYLGQNEVKLNGKVISATNYQMPEYPDGIRVGLFREICWDTNGVIVPGGAGRRISRIYGYKGWRNGILLGNYIPTLDPAGRPCMFDTVSRKPFYNEGDGEFIVGMTVEQVRELSLPLAVDDNKKLVLVLPKEAFVDVLAQEALERARKNGWELTVVNEDSDIPASYKRLEYLQGTGTQYIDTRLLINNGSKITVDCEISDDSGYESGGLFGAQLMSTDTDRAGMGEFTKNSHAWVFWGSVSEEVRSVEPTERHVIELSQAGLFYNDSKLRDFSRIGDFQTSGSCWLFARNRNDNVVNKYRGKIYSFTFSQDEYPRLNFVPVLDITGAPCMFDTVSRKPFYNSGTGDFFYPNMETQETTYNLRRRDYAKMTEHGIRRLYHVPEGCEMSKEEYAEQNEFKILIETPQPEEGYWIPQWHEREDCIELEWIEAEPPSNEF